MKYKVDVEKVFIDKWDSWIIHVIISENEDPVVQHTERWFGRDDVEIATQNAIQNAFDKLEIK